MKPARRFLVAVNRAAGDWSVTVSCADTGWLAAVRTMLRGTPSDGARAFPMPPAGEVPDPATLGGGAKSVAKLGGDPGAVAQLFDRLAQRAQRQESVEWMGRHLFNALLGTPLWDELRGQAQGADFIELALQWEPSERDLQRLNWEVMHSGAGFLSRGAVAPDGQTFRVVITRVVPQPAGGPVTQVAPAALRKLGPMPRILYVVGASLSDPQIRAGAEYFGLFRQLRGEAGDGQRWRHLPTRVLVRASARRLEAAMLEFGPDIVHFICHGDVRQGNGVLSFAPDLQHPQDPTEFGGSQVLELLQPAKDRSRLPAIVVLSACHSGGGADGGMGGPEQSAPLAAELVQGGVPVVVAMAGAVADHACRLFTRTFGAALVRGQSLLEATERARRAALIFGAEPKQTLDWAMPVVFRAPHVPVDYGPPEPSDLDAATGPRDIVDQLELEPPREPPLAAHEEALDDCHEALSSDRMPALFLTGDEDSGKSRFLRELALLAVGDGNVPVLVSVDRPELAFRDLAAVGEALRLAVERTRRAFGVQGALPKVLLRIGGKLNFADPPADFPEALRDELVARGELTGRGLLLALQRDLLALAGLARAEGRCRAPDGRLVLLLDQLDFMPTAFLESVFADRDHRVFGLHGVGDSAATFAPVVLAAGPAGINAGWLRKERDGGGDHWLKRVQLGGFPEERDQDVFTYRRVLLSPFNPKLFPRYSDFGWVWNPEAGDDAIQESILDLRALLSRRLPGDFATKELYAWVMSAAKTNVMRKADDNELLARLDKP